jgi:hypothetical protein
MGNKGRNEKWRSRMKTRRMYADADAGGRSCRRYAGFGLIRVALHLITTTMKLVYPCGSSWGNENCGVAARSDLGNRVGRSSSEVACVAERYESEEIE